MSDKVRITLLPNPFDTEERIRKEFDFVEGYTVSQYLDAFGTLPIKRGVKLLGAVNGKEAEDILAVVPRAGDSVVITAKPEAAVAAAVASWVVSAIAGASAAGGFLGLLGAGMFGAALLYGATYLATTFVVGWGISQIASALGLGQSPDAGSVGDNVNESPTYGWGILSPTETEGNPIPIIFGKHKVAGQLINTFTELSDNNEYYYALLAVNDGAVDSISDIRINDQPYTYFRDVEVYTRLGELNEDAIPGFNKVVQHHSPGARLTEATYTIQTDGNNVDSLELVFTAPYGLYHVNDSGGLDTVSVDVVVEYRAVGSSSWTTHSTERISGATTSTVRRSVSITGLPPDQYEVRVRRDTPESTDWKTKDAIYFASFKEVISKDFIYPGIAKYAVKALATDQLSGASPSLTCVVNRAHVSVYNPYTAQWEYRDASNPAWAAYALLNTYHDIPPDQIVYSDFEEWANYCDELVDGEPRFRVNIVFDSLSNVWADVQRIASLARARIIRRNAKYGVFVDKPESTVTHLFTMGNIVEGSFKQYYLPMKDRANAIEVTYMDPDRDYTNQVVLVYSSDYESTDSVAQKASIKINAAIPRAQAIREAAYFLNSNKYLVRTIEFEAAIDSFDCTIGDLVYFQHDVPDYGNSFGGRIVEAGNDDGSGNPYVRLDREVELVAGNTYKILVRLRDDSLVEKTVQAVYTTHTTDTLLLTSGWSVIPDEYDLYAFGKADAYKKTYRVTNITRAQDQTRRITCVEYVPEIYSDVPYVIEEPTGGGSVTQEAVHVTAREFLTYSPGGDYLSNVQVSWNANREDVGSNWDVWLIDETLGFVWDRPGFDTSFADSGDIPGVQFVGRTPNMNYIISPSYLTLGHTYSIVITPAGAGLVDTGDNSTRIQILGKLAPPADVTGFIGEWNPIKRVVNFVWSPVPDIDLSHYEIREGTSWDTATVVVKAAKTESASISIEEGVHEVRTYLIKAVDTSGIYSENYASTDVAIDTAECPLQTPTGLTLSTYSAIAKDGTDHVYITASWDANAEASEVFRNYELLVEDMATGAKAMYSTAQTFFTFEVMPNHEYGVSVRAVDMTLNKTEWSSQVTIVSAADSTPPSQPTGLTCTGFTGFIRLKWNHGAEPDLSHFDVYRNSTDDFSTATKIGSSVRDFVGTWATAHDDPGDYNTYYYWVVAVDTSGNESPPAGPATGAKVKVGGINIEPLSIEETHIADDAISSPKIQANAIQTNHLTAKAITTEKIDTNAVTSEKIQAAAVTTDKLDVGAVTADKIDVSSLSAISANVGTVTSGVIQSSNWSTTAGSKIDLNSGVVKLGGSSSPKLYWDGVNLSVVGQITVSSGSYGLSYFSDAGALATRDTVDWRSHVTGAGKPEDYADVTANNTAADTSKVNGLPSSYVSGWAHSANKTTIDGGKIYTRSITADKIAAHSITADELSTGRLITSSAQIGDAVITNAKIGTAAVDTLKIAGNAVTTSVAAYSASGVTASSSDTWYTLQSASINYSGDGVVYIFTTFMSGMQNSADDPGNFEIGIYRGATLLRQTGTFGLFDSIATVVPVSGPYFEFYYSLGHTYAMIDTPGAAGTYTYYVKIYYKSDSSTIFADRSLLLLNTKR